MILCIFQEIKISISLPNFENSTSPAQDPFLGHDSAPFSLHACEKRLLLMHKVFRQGQGKVPASFQFLYQGQEVSQETKVFQDLSVFCR